MALEARFETLCGPERLHALQWKGLSSLVIFDLFVFVDWPLLGNKIWISALVRLAVVTPAMFVGQLLIVWKRQAVVRETTALVISALMAASPLAIYHGKPLLVAIGHTALIVISIVAVNIVRLRVPYGLVQGVMLITADVVFARLNPSLKPSEQFLFVSLVSAAIVYNFLFNRLLESEERKIFLSAMRDEATSEELRLQAAALEAAANSIVITDVNGNIAWTNLAFSMLSGYSAEEVLGKNPRILNSGIHYQAFYAQLWATIKAGKIWRGEMINRRKDGSCYSEEMTITPVLSQSGTVTHFVAIKEDITERKRAEEALREAEEKYRAIFEDAVVGIFQYTPEGRPLRINLAFARMCGYDSPEQLLAEVSNLPQQLIVNSSQLTEWTHLFDQDGVVRGAEVEVYDRGREKKWVLLNLRAVRDRDGKIVLHEGTVEDITDRKLAEDRLHFLAYHDGLTGLPNRALLDDRLVKAFARARRQDDKVALLYLDLDRFKLVNDSLGHAMGDLFLREIAGHLNSRIREQETVARLGGDEFLIVLGDLKDVADVAAAAQRIIAAMNEAVTVQDHSLNFGCSLGISIFPDHGIESETLIANAAAALYRAKSDGRNNFRLYTEDMNAQAIQRLAMENDLRQALDQKQFFLVYQPQMEISTGAITGLEALIRWNAPKLGLIPPSQFIPIAENCGLITRIGEWTLRTACAQARKWQGEGLRAVPVAVNVSALQFRQDGFLEAIRRVLYETELDPQYLELELTESLLISNADVVLAIIRELKALGVRLAIDDFGTGYSSLSYLRQFRVDKLKIDMSFIQNVNVDHDVGVITTAIIKMAKGLHLKVIAEGVENESQFLFLQAQECDEIQGYYFSRPLTADKVADKLRGAPASPIGA